MHAPELRLQVVETKASQSVKPPVLLALNNCGHSYSLRANLCVFARSLDETTDQAEQQSPCVNGATSGAYVYYGPEVKHAGDWYQAPAEMPSAWFLTFIYAHKQPSVLTFTQVTAHQRDSREKKCYTGLNLTSHSESGGAQKYVSVWRASRSI
jgi:hypothetical protein